VGTPIPAWYTKDGELIVAHSREEAEKKAERMKLTQDEDVARHVVLIGALAVFDFGMARRNRRPEDVLPDVVLITARDIIFLWVSRMVMTV